MFGQIDGYDFEEPSDQDSAESSEDEIDIILNGSWEQKQRVRRRSLGLDERDGDDPADEFEREMERELNEKMKNLEDERSVQAANVPRGIEKKAAEEFYDEIYFDSDDEEKDADGSKVKRRKPTDDELLYDPNMDDDDQKWVDAQRRKYQPDEEDGSAKTTPAPAKTPKALPAPSGQSSSQSTSPARSRPLPASDAVLNCPCCMILLCLDCQRHEIYRSQYRAMFVFNCRVDQSETLRFPTKNKRKLGKKENIPRMPPPPSAPPSAAAIAAGASSSSAASQQQHDSNEYYHPVRCNECNTEVAVFDADEVYHFYNALSSHV